MRSSWLGPPQRYCQIHRVISSEVAYDAVDLVVQTTDFKGDVITYSYNASDPITSKPLVNLKFRFCQPIAIASVLTQQTVFLGQSDKRLVSPDLLSTLTWPSNS